MHLYFLVLGTRKIVPLTGESGVAPSGDFFSCIISMVFSYINHLNDSTLLGTVGSILRNVYFTVLIEVLLRLH